MGGIVNAIADAFEWVFELFDPFLSKYDKHDIYKQIQIQNLFPQQDDIFRKKLIAFKHQTKSNYATIRKLIFDKVKYTNKARLDKMGLLTKYDGSVHVLTKSRMELHISNKYYDSDVNIPYLVSRLYMWELRRVSSRSYLYISGKYEVIRYTWSDYNDTNLLNTCIYDSNEKMYYCWVRTFVFKDPTDEDLAYETGDYIDWKVAKWLYEKYDTKEENIQYADKLYFKKVHNKVKYITYNIKDNDWYKPILINDSIERRYDQDNNVMEIHLINVDDSDDDIWIEWVIDKSVLLTIGYTSINYPKGNIITEYYDEVVDEEFSTSFLSIPVKKDGDMVNNDSIMLQNWLKDVGMTLPDNIDSPEVKDVLYAALGKYKDPTTPTLTNYNKYVYGSITDKRNVSINTGVQVFDYFWSVDYVNAEVSNIYRGMSVNGFTYAKILEGEQSSAYVTYTLNQDGKIDTGVNLNETESSEGPMYLVPLEAFQRMPLHEFYPAYYKTLKSISYAEKEVVTKWYRTEFFQYFIQVSIIAIACTVGGPVGCAIAIGGVIAYHLLVDEFGVDPTVAAIIVAVVSFGVNIYASGSQAAMANSSSTASTTGTDASTAGANSMSSTTTTTGTMSGTTASTSANVSNVATQSVFEQMQIGLNNFIDTFKRGLEIQMAQGISTTTMLKLVNMGFSGYSNLRMKHENKKLENMQNEIEKIDKQAKEIQNALDEMFKNSINLLPVKFDTEYSMLYSNPMEMQIVYDHMNEIEPFGAISVVYN